MFKKLLIDRWALHLDSYTLNRYRLIRPFLLHGDLRALNVGTGGGVETLRLLRRGNHVTVLEIDEHTAARTTERVLRNGYGDRFDRVVGHFLKVEVPGQFDEVMMCEVLEHIKDDIGVLRKIASILRPGGRLILSTPTASFGQMMGDQVVDDEDPLHPEFHVRGGYDGPELDKMLESAGLKTERRILNGYLLSQYYHLLERKCKCSPLLRPISLLLGLIGRIVVPLLELVRVQPSNQVTIASRV